MANCSSDYEQFTKIATFSAEFLHHCRVERYRTVGLAQFMAMSSHGAAKMKTYALPRICRKNCQIFENWFVLHLRY